MRLAAIAAIACLLLGGCTPDELAQPEQGDGWRLVSWTREGAPIAPQVGDVQLAFDELGIGWDHVVGPPADPESEVDVVVMHVVSGSCPQVRFDGFSIDRERALMEARFTDVGDLFYLGACSSDANPVAYWLAVERDRLPESPFTLRSEDAPDVASEIDLRD
jgi:hypothetical protein